ncbi:MAG: tRNA lysidine(34) synthetase TilS [Verrucomicrobiota bacterium]
MDLPGRVRLQLIRTIGPPAGPTPLVVAVSGGLDSMVLLDVLASLAGEWPLVLHVAHGHHGLRGAEADADARLVEEAARARGLDFSLGRLQPGTRGKAGTGRESVEMWARRRRHAFLADVARRAGARWIALAHHLDDQAELLLLRLLRGAGSTGLGGMHSPAPSPADPDLRLWRPLLDVRKTDLATHAAGAGLRWREDASNADRGIPRNRIRQEVLPALAAVAGPALPEILARTAELAAAEAEFLRGEALRWRTTPGPAFAELPAALQRAIVHEQLLELGQEPTFELVERLRQAVDVSQSAPGDRLWRRNQEGGVQPGPPPPGAFVEEALAVLLAGRAGRIRLPGANRGVDWRIRTRRTGARRVRPPAGGEWLDAGRVGSGVELRHWRPGDRFQPLGFPRPAKLQDLFTARRVPPAERRARLVLAADGGTLCWVEGLPPGEAFKVRADTTRLLEVRVFPARDRESSRPAIDPRTRHVTLPQRSKHGGGQ